MTTPCVHSFPDPPDQPGDCRHCGFSYLEARAETQPHTCQPTRKWTDIDPADAVNLNLAEDLTITAPLNEVGERCPWPWEPQQLVNVPLGQYHCGYCGAMVMAGMPHIDYADDVLAPAAGESRSAS